MKRAFIAYIYIFSLCHFSLILYKNRPILSKNTTVIASLNSLLWFDSRLSPLTNLSFLHILLLPPQMLNVRVEDRIFKLKCKSLPFKKTSTFISPFGILILSDASCFEWFSRIDQQFPLTTLSVCTHKNFRKTIALSKL